MNKKPYMLRLIFSIIVVAIFAVSIHPLKPRDFFKTFEEMLAKRGEAIENVIGQAKTMMDEDKTLMPSVALERAADGRGVDLTKYVDARNLTNNRDVISLVLRNASSSIRPGLDLNGGVEFLLELVPDEDMKAIKEEKPAESRSFDSYRDNAIEIIRNRLESLSIYESEISPAGDNLISLRAPIVRKDEKLKLKKIIQMSAKLAFRLVHEKNAKLVADFKKNPKTFNPPVGYERMSVVQAAPGEKPKREYYFVKIRREMSGKNVVYAAPNLDQFGKWEIHLRFNVTGTNRFAEVTKESKGRQLAIVLDGKLYSAPVIRDAIEGGNAVISGNFSREEAENVANALESGSLPVKINVVASFDTAPTLGAESVKYGTYSGIIALLGVMIFMLIYYMRAGLVADVALVVNVVLVLGALAAFGATLTLPGIAGIILTMGMSVDANVLIFERIREELKNNKTLANAIENGYARAFTTILDANLTTLFTALILMWQGTGAIKGFAVTLSIGICTSMFTTLFLTRLIFDIMTRYLPSRTLKMCEIFSNPKIDFLGMRKITTTISAVFIIAAVVIVGLRGGGVMGIDFTGGTQIMYNYKGEFTKNQVNEVLKKNGFDGCKVVFKTSPGESGSLLEVVIPEKITRRDESKTSAVVTEILTKALPEADLSVARETFIGGLIGAQFTKAAVIAILCALIGIVIYISLRFEFAFAVAAIVALVHDVCVATGVYLWCGRELSLPVIAALLTIIGYSLNDTIVVFDRIREDLGLIKDKTYKEIINLSINQTLSRTILTSTTTLIVLLVLFFFGGVAINDFVLVMLLGVVIGTYSSIFVASPIVAVWHNRIGAKAKRQSEEIKDPATAIGGDAG